MEMVNICMDGTGKRMNGWMELVTKWMDGGRDVFCNKMDGWMNEWIDISID